MTFGMPETRVNIVAKPLGTVMEDLFEDCETFKMCPREILFVKGKTIL